MKVITQGTVRIGAPVKKGKLVKLDAKYLKPGVHDIDDEIARALIDKDVAQRHGAGEDKAGGDARAPGKPPGGGRA
jgi:hypothetical protein